MLAFDTTLSGFPSVGTEEGIPLAARGDTLVCLADGRRVPISELVGREVEVLHDQLLDRFAREERSTIALPGPAADGRHYIFTRIIDGNKIGIGAHLERWGVPAAQIPMGRPETGSRVEDGPV